LPFVRDQTPGELARGGIGYHAPVEERFAKHDFALSERSFGDGIDALRFENWGPVIAGKFSIGQRRDQVGLFIVPKTEIKLFETRDQSMADGARKKMRVGRLHRDSRG